MDYGGDLTAQECWQKLQQDSNTVMVDVRTQAEWAYVGLPSLSGEMREIVLQEWQVFPQMSVDPQFCEQLSEKLEQMNVGRDAALCFLCRSGVRSLAAAKAMTAFGYPNTYNITAGFEGDPDEHGHRGKTNGWKAEKLPWRQR